MFLTHFSPDSPAVISPTAIIPKIPGIPSRAVSCFSHLTFSRLLDTLGGEPVAKTATANMDITVYKTLFKGVPLALFMIPVGEPAAIGIMEEAAAMGIERFTVFGTCGVLKKEVSDCAVILPTAAIRDEGASFHYAPPSEEISCNDDTLLPFTGLLNELHIHFHTGKTWTTDAFYRETAEKVEECRRLGCICVEMEAAGLSAWAKFRGKTLLHFFYAADNLDSEAWDPRSLSNHALLDEKDKIALLAAEAAIRI